MDVTEQPARRGRPPKAAEPEGAFVLARNFGWRDGQHHRFLPAGTVLDHDADAALISRLHALGASFA